MSILVTGGAGYIGSHVVRLLEERGDRVVVVDNLITGDARRVSTAPIFELDLSDPSRIAELAAVMSDNAVTAVVHFAAQKQVGESVAKPAWYFQQNIGSLANLLLAMEEARVDQLVFSSSAAVYGATEGAVLTETAPTEPINPYGTSKLVGEQLIDAATPAQGLKAVSLRYFNVAGAGWPELGDTAALNLVPMVFERLDAGEPPVIFGDDYATPDGTCVRDYIHVMDLAEAHLATLDTLTTSPYGHLKLNVGTGTGYSVRDVIDKILTVSGLALKPEVSPRRGGDPAVVVADAELINRVAGWRARFDLDDIVRSAWRSHLLLAPTHLERRDILD